MSYNIRSLDCPSHEDDVMRHNEVMNKSPGHDFCYSCQTTFFGDICRNCHRHQREKLIVLLKTARMCLKNGCIIPVHLAEVIEECNDIDIK